MKTRSFCAALLLAPSLVSAQMTLVETGGTFRTDATNLALSATPKSDGDYGGGVHYAVNINDGNYGNASSWLGSAGMFYGSIALGFSTPVTLGSVAFGRDNTGGLADRATGPYEIYYSTNYVSGANVYGYTNWHLLQILDYASSPPESPALRHLYNFATPLTNVTGFMISVPSFLNPDGYAAMAIDEIELYATTATAPSAVPEPSTYAALLAAAALCATAIRRRMAQ
ncbi:MAG TPA: PEP-CTERM sorting domain-containing protein [Acidobacteriota bacterium]|nr:PEP-CTERM sorting domain-containing protein [Acidobacteriota bacterium]